MKDVAETMVVSESDVKKCQDQAGSEGKAGGGEKTGDMGKK